MIQTLTSPALSGRRPSPAALPPATIDVILQHSKHLAPPDRGLIEGVYFARAFGRGTGAGRWGASRKWFGGGWRESSGGYQGRCSVTLCATRTRGRLSGPPLPKR